MMNEGVTILTHDEIVDDCLDSMAKEFNGLTERDYMMVLRTLDFVYSKGIKRLGNQND